jgi:uncharacterized protein (DUF2336 family)
MERVSVSSDVCLTDLPFLATLAESPRAADRQLWLRVAADYVLARPLAPATRPPEFAAAFDAALAAADDATRVALAQKLADCLAAADILATIESLGGEAALVALERAKTLPRARLLVAATEDGARAGAVARRADLDAELVDLLVAREDVETVLALARNRSAALGSRAFATLARRARRNFDEAGDARLAAALLDRAPARVEQAALFLEANSTQRVDILAAAQRAALGLPRDPKRRRDAGAALAELERFALARDDARFAETLAEALACAIPLADRIARDPSGEPLAVALASLGSPDDVAVRILTSRDLQDGADYRRVGALARLKDALDPAAADLVVAAMIGEAPSARAARQPALDPTASPTPSRPAAAAGEIGPRVWIKRRDLAPAALSRPRGFAPLAGRRRDDERQ